MSGQGLSARRSPLRSRARLLRVGFCPLDLLCPGRTTRGCAFARGEKSRQARAEDRARR